ncbi:MAG: RnfABCDGE type electron transport complex subunit D [Bacillota bacterium]
MLLSASPHLRAALGVPQAMRDVVIALFPAVVMGVIYFGPYAAAVVALAVVASVGTEYALCRLAKAPVTTSDWSAMVTGLLLGLNLPPTVPLWLPVVGGVVAIALVKRIYGGLGHNFLNPALAARALLVAAWPARMTTWVSPFDGISTPTPLAQLVPRAAEGLGAPPAYLDMFIGNTAGCIGETSAAALLIGALYLLLRGVIDWRIPVAFIGTVAAVTWAFGPLGWFTGDFIAHILAGGLILGAFYMATDWVTSPMTRRGRVYMGIGCGLITVLIRLWGGYPEGVSYSILLMNIATPLIDRYTAPRPFGAARR